MSDKALYAVNSEVIPVGVVDGLLKRTAANDGWEFKTAAQLGLSPTLLQTLFVEQSTNITTTSATYTTLLTQAVTIQTGGILLINVTASVSNTNANTNISMQLTIDGVAVRGAATRCLSTNTPSSLALVYRRSGLSVGAHTVALQWLTSANTAQIRPATTTNEHASLMIQQVTV